MMLLYCDWCGEKITGHRYQTAERLRKYDTAADGALETYCETCAPFIGQWKEEEKQLFAAADDQHLQVEREHQDDIATARDKFMAQRRGNRREPEPPQRVNHG